MRKRRVGVTARSRQIEGSQETGSLQVDTEMAAPLELRTPIGTCGGKGRQQSADGSMATKAQESTGRMQSEESSQGKRDGKMRRGSGAPKARMRRCPILRQGAFGKAGGTPHGGGALRAHEALPHTPPGGKSPETPVFSA